jgi:hypothetical protein
MAFSLAGASRLADYRKWGVFAQLALKKTPRKIEI